MHFGHGPLYWVKLIYNVCFEGLFFINSKSEEILAEFICFYVVN